MRFPDLVTYLALHFVFGVLAVGEAADATASGREKTKTYQDLATLECDGGSISSIGGVQWASGFTLVPIDTPNPGNSRFAISMATGHHGPDPGKLRVVAKDAEGSLHNASSQSSASASGNKHRVVTVVCDFPVSHEDVRELTIQQELQLIDLGMVKARVIIQEEEEERLGIILP